MAEGEGNGQKGIPWNPAAVADIAMSIINRVGLPLVILGLITYYLVPAHLTFLETATQQQAKQTEIIKQFSEIQTESNNRVMELTEAIGSDHFQKLERLESMDQGITENGTSIKRVETKVDAVRAAVETKN